MTVLLYIFVWLGRHLGYNNIDVYAPGDHKSVEAITFAREEWYVNRIAQVVNKE